MAMYGRYAHHIFPFIDSQDNFYAAQHSDGLICRVINEADGTDHSWGLGPDHARTVNPPLFGWAEIETYKVTADRDRLRLILPALEHYIDWIRRHRSGADTPHHLYWSNGQASGMDNTPRDTDRPQPADGWDSHSATDHAGWIDLSSQMVMAYNDLAYICRELGQKRQSAQYTKQADSIAARINRWLWDDRAGLYFDVDPSGRKTSWITASTFWPMLAGVASPSQCAALVRHLVDPHLFWTPIPVPSLACNQPGYDKMGCYWKGGVWAPVNYMIVEGLKKNGYDSLAVALSTRYLDALARVYDKTHTLWECYSPEIYSPATNASGVNLVEPDFVGWTGLGPISMFLATIIGVELDAPHNLIRWHISAPCRHGVEQLMFHGAPVDLLATPVPHGYQLTMRSAQRITVEVIFGTRTTTFHLVPDKTLTQTVLHT
jgi:glycogen debranching enzyme